MKWISMLAVAAVAALAVPAQNSVAVKKVSGYAVGRWAMADASTKWAKGTMFDLLDKPLYSVQFRMHGLSSGSVDGYVGELPRPGTHAFTLVGQYWVTNDGTTRVASQLMLTGPKLPLPIMLGQFEALLHPSPPFGTDVPWWPTSGDFHARWWHY